DRIYTELFSGINPRLLDKPIWIVAPDGPLFELPFAALVERVGSQSVAPQYVVERHAIQIVAGISSLLGAATTDFTVPVVGLGDAIYNRADPRSKNPARGRNAGRGATPAIELARLVGSSREIESCARIWRSQGYATILLNGAAATRENLAAVFRRNPAVV